MHILCEMVGCQIPASGFIFGDDTLSTRFVYPVCAEHLADHPELAVTLDGDSLPLHAQIRQWRQGQRSGRLTRHGAMRAVAEAMAARADCTRRQVACVFVDDRGRIISVGYNGLPSGMTGCIDGGCPRGQLTPEQVAHYADYDSGPGRCGAVHAEINAILNAGVRPAELRGAVAYVTEHPCIECLRALVAVGIRNVTVTDTNEQFCPKTRLEEFLRGTI